MRTQPVQKEHQYSPNNSTAPSAFILCQTNLMTKKAFQKWLTDPKIALSLLYKDLKHNPPFDVWPMEGDFIEQAHYKKEGKDELAFRKAIAKWLYNTDNGDLFREGIAWHFDRYYNYLLPIYGATVLTGDRSREGANLYLSKTASRIITVIDAAWTLRSGRTYEIELHNASGFEIKDAIDDFINQVEDYAGVCGEYELITEDVEEYEEEGRIGGSVSYESYLKWIKVKGESYILV